MQVRTVVDLFAGCGGLSLGLSLAGMRGLFAIERDGMAFETFSANFVQSSAPPAHRFKWPRWLHQQAWGIDDLLAEHKGDLEKLRGRSEEHTSELQSLMRISYAVFCLKKKKTQTTNE